MNPHEISIKITKSQNFSSLTVLLTVEFYCNTRIFVFFVSKGISLKFRILKFQKIGKYFRIRCAILTHEIVPVQNSVYMEY